jgi:hypothetical protein
MWFKRQNIACTPATEIIFMHLYMFDVVFLSSFRPAYNWNFAWKFVLTFWKIRRFSNCIWKLDRSAMVPTWIISSFTVAANMILTSYSFAEGFRLMRFPNGDRICARGRPTITVLVADITIAYPSLDSSAEVPDEVRCAYCCTHMVMPGNSESVCMGFNYWRKDKRCEFYSTASLYCASAPGCTHYSVSLKHGLLPIVK